MLAQPYAPTPYRALMVSPVQEESVDLQEEREKLAPLALLDQLDNLDPLLVSFTLDKCTFYFSRKLITLWNSTGMFYISSDEISLCLSRALPDPLDLLVPVETTALL